MKLRSISLAVGALLAAAQGSASAESAFPDASFSFSGFGTLGVTQTSTDQAEFGPVGVPNGAKDSPKFSTDSKLGLQATGKLNKIFSSTVQVLSKHNGDGNYKPAVEWAFVKAQVVPSLAVRVGRIGAPLFAVSDFRDVNYANLWVRPPYDIYSQVPVSNLDGVDAIYQTTLGPATVNLQMFSGTGHSVVTGFKIKAKNMRGLNVTAEFDNGISLRAGTSSTNLHIDNPNLDRLVSTLKATPFASVGQALDLDDKTATFSGVGIGYDSSSWVGSLEYTVKRTDAYLPDATAWQLTAGHRFGAWTPYAMYSRSKMQDVNIQNTIPKTVPQLAMLSGIVDAVMASQYNDETTKALGVRWDFRKSMALKAQIDHVTPHNGKGMFNAPQPGFGKESVNVYSLNLDFVF